MDLVIHAGTGKAGSTSIQFCCRDSRDRLAELGVLYPMSPGRARHEALSLAVKSDAELAITPTWHRRGRPEPQRLRRTFRRRLRREIEESGLDRVVLSDEELFGLSRESLERLGRISRAIADRRRMVVYLRRQDDHLVSRYQQGVKIGWVVRLSDWAREDFSGLYDYDARLRMHEQVVAPDEIVVRRFEPDHFVGGSLFADFLEAAEIPSNQFRGQAAPQRNQSLDAESIEFLRLLNQCRVDREGAAVGLIDNRPVVKRLVEASTGPLLTLPQPSLDEFMARWDEPNRRVARRYFGEEGPLFQERRAARSATSVQRLDPSRLDHFLTLCEIPQALHAPLRALARQEAG